MNYPFHSLELGPEVKDPIGLKTAFPRFTAPDVEADAPLTFRLTVRDGSASSSDQVKITVLSRRAVVAVNPANPVDGIPSEPLVFFVPWPAGEATALREEPLAPGSDVSAYQMISLSLDPTDDDPGAVLGATLGPYDPSSWRLFREEGGERLEYLPDKKKNQLKTLEVGKGYWLISRQGGRAQVSGTPRGLDQPFSITLGRVKPDECKEKRDKCWNQIGHSFGFPVDWEKVQVRCRKGARPVLIGEPANDCVDPGLLSYERREGVGVDFFPAERLLPWYGYLVYNLGSGEDGEAELLIPAVVL